MNFIAKIINRNIMMSPLYFLANYQERQSIMYQIHWYSFKRYLLKGTIRSICLRYLLVLTHPFWVILLVMLYIIKFGKIVAQRNDLSIRTLFFESLFWSLFKNITPLDYYRNQLYLKENKSQLKYLILGREAQILFRSLNNSFALDYVDDKVKFYEICAKNRLPTPAIYEVIDGETSIVDLPQQDFILKPSRGSRGEGIELWFYKGEHIYRGDQGLELDDKTLIKHIKEKIKNKQDRIILQQRIRNHASLGRFTKEALITVRVVTLRNLTKETMHLMSVLILPVGEKLLRPRVILCPVHEKTGELGIATNYSILKNVFTHHPDTGEPIVAFKVPYWAEIVRLATEAHTCFPDYVSLGWDIAITDRGPVIIEANQTWDVETMQKPHQMPLGKTIFAESAVNIYWKEDPHEQNYNAIHNLR